MFHTTTKSDASATKRQMADEQTVKATVETDVSGNFKAVKATLGLNSVPVETDGGYEWNRCFAASIDGVEPLAVGSGSPLANDSPTDLSVITTSNPQAGETETQFTVRGPSGDVVTAMTIIERICECEADYEKVL